VVGGTWAGPVSFRKPTTFGISVGLTTLTPAWVAGQLRITDRTGWLLLGLLAVADTAEVVWISLFGAAGVMKVTHAVAIHAIQVLPTLAWLLSFAGLPERRRVAMVRVGSAGYVALVMVNLLQAAAGLTPFDVGVAAAVLYLLGVVLLGAAFLTALLALRKPTSAAA
jgi:hypothetical protein